MRPLTVTDFQAFGDVLCVGQGGTSANQGRALKRSHLTPLVNLRTPVLESGEPSCLSNALSNPPAKANVCTFRVVPSMMPFEIK